MVIQNKTYRLINLQKCIFVFLISFVFGIQGWGQNVIDFETIGAGYTPSATEGSGDTDVFNRSNPNIGGNSTYIWAVEDISLTDPSITLDQIDVSGASSFSFSIDMLTPNTEDWDTSDELLITYSIDGGAYQNLMWVQSNDDGDAFNAPAAIDADFDGTGDDGQELPALVDGFGVGVGSNFVTFSTGDIALSGNSTLDIKLQFNGLTSAAEGIYLDDITINTVSTSPTITLSTSSLTGFSYEEGSGPSAEQNFTVEGSNLTDDITLTPPTDYEISETSGSGFGSSITLSQSGGSVSTTTIYVRLKSGLSIGTYNGETITASSSGATDQTVTCDGEVVCPSVSIPTATAATSASGTGFTANWNSVAGATGYELDVYSDGGGLDMTADGDGSSADPYSVSQALALPEGSTEYFVKGYVVGRGNPIAFGIPASNDFSVVLAETVDETNASNVLVAQVESVDRPSWGLSTNPSLYQTGVKVEGYRDNYGGDPSIEGASNWAALAGGGTTYHLQNEDVGNVTTYDVSGLTAGETYYYVVRAYNDCGSESANSNEITVNLSCSDPTTEATSLSFPDTQYNQMDVSWTAGDGDNHLVVASTSPITGTPSDNTSYAPDANFGDGATLNAGEYVVFAGSGTNFTMTGLTSDTQYYINVFEYNCDSGNEQYLASSPLAGDETTLASIPAVSGLDVTCTTETTATVEWTNPSTGDWGGVIIAIRNSSLPVHTLSDDPTTVSADAVFGDGHEFGTTTPYSYVVYKGSGTSVTITGLTQGQDYSIKAISYYGSLIGDVTTTTISSLEIGEVTAASATTENSQTNLSWSNPGACYDEILVVGHEASSVIAVPSGDGSSYTASGSFGVGTDIGTNEYVVYKGTSTLVTVTGLTNGTTYYFTIFVRVGTEWSDGVEVFVTPSEVTNFIPGDLAIIAVNTNYQGHATLGDFEEFTFVAFKDINVGTSIDFTENGWEREYADAWGTTEGTIRLTRESNGVVTAGTSITVVMHEANGVDATDFDVYINGTDELAAGYWSITELNPTDGSGFNLNPDDDIWIMQGGSWIENSTGSNPTYHDDEYTGYVLYGWTATGWPGSDPAGSTMFSNLYPACECFNTNVSGLTNQDKVKYTGPMTDASKLDWINRFNDETNWTGYADDASYDAGTPDYRNNGVTIGVLPGGFESGRWTATYDKDWFNCRNWQNLTIPNENTDVVVSTTYASDDAVVDSSDNALCHGLTIESGIGIDYSDDNYTGNTIEIHGDLLNQSAGTNIISTGGEMLFASDETAEITTNGAMLYDVEFDGTGEFTLLDDMTVDGTLTLTDGVVSTGTNKVHVQNTVAGAISGHSAASYINGNLRRDITGAGLYDLPVGNSTFYELASLDITSANNLSYIDVFFENSDLGVINISGLNITIDGTLLTSVLDAGYWQVEPDGGLTSIDYDIILNETGATNAASVPEQHAVIKRPDALSDWNFEGIHDNATQAINGSVVTAQVSSLSGFSQFAIARSSQWPLAIELVDFNVSCHPDGLLAEWITASEENSDYFCIQHSSDGHAWETMKKHYAFGTTNIQQNYHMLLENAPADGYYRLTEVDMNGKVTAYAPQYINCDTQRDNTVFMLYPNPAEWYTQISSVNSNADYYKLVVINANGKTINTLNWEHPDESALKMNTENVEAGMYILRILNESEMHHLQLIVK